MGPSPERRLEPEEVHREHRVGYGDASASVVIPDTASRIRVVGLVPGPDLQIGVRSPASAAPRSSRGTTMNGATPGPRTSIVRRSSGIAS